MFLSTFSRWINSQQKIDWSFVIVIFIFLNASAYLFFSLENNDRLAKGIEQSQAKQHEFMANLNVYLDQQVKQMQVLLQVIMQNHQLRQAMQNNNRDRLFTLTDKIYQPLSNIKTITHFNFISTDGIILLRMHNPFDYGERVSRYTFNQAREKQSDVYGIELSSYQELTMRLVMKWSYEGRLLGYLDLGLPIRHIISDVQENWIKQHNERIDVVVLSDKSRINEEKWRHGRQLFSTQNSWNQLSQRVIDTTTFQLSHAYKNLFENMILLNNRLTASQLDGRFKHVTLQPLTNVMGSKVGEIGLVFDVHRSIAEIETKFLRHLLSSLFFSIFLIFIVELFLFYKQQRTEKTKLLLESEVRQRTNELDSQKEALTTLLSKQKRSTELKNQLNNALEMVFLANNQTSLFTQVLQLVESKWYKNFDVGFFDKDGNPIVVNDLQLKSKTIKYDTDDGKNFHIPIYVKENHQLTLVMRSKTGLVLDVTDYEFFNALAKVISLGVVRLEHALQLKQSNVILEHEVRLRTKALEKSMLEAEKANHVKSQFLANMSHEIRTPMHAIISFSSYGMNRVEKVSAKKLFTYYERIHRSGERLLQLLDDLLDISKYEAKKMSLNIASGNLQQLLERCLEEMESLLQKKKLTVLIKNNCQSCLAEYDPERMTQVITNLLSNAIKFSPEHGKILIGITLSSIEVEQQLVPGLQLTFKDEGTGIPKEELKDIFDKFVQSKKVRAGVGGTGLGLAICMEILQLHKGKIWAKNNSDKGAEFIVLIPQKQLEVQKYG